MTIEDDIGFFERWRSYRLGAIAPTSMTLVRRNLKVLPIKMGLSSITLLRDVTDNAWRSGNVGPRRRLSLVRFVGFAFLLVMFQNAAWAQSCPTPAMKHGRLLHGHERRVFIKECCERLSEEKGGSLEEKRRFVAICQTRSTH
jgi:hypothetical protein